jgi:hypothetical protein
MNTNIHFWSHLAQFVVEWEMYQTKVVKKIEVRILCSVTLFFLENRVVYEIMWRNGVQLSRPQITIWGMRIACWIPKATNTHPECNIYCFFTTKIVERGRLNVTLYVHCLCCNQILVKTEISTNVFRIHPTEISWKSVPQFSSCCMWTDIHDGANRRIFATSNFESTRLSCDARHLLSIKKLPTVILYFDAADPTWERQ